MITREKRYSIFDLRAYCKEFCGIADECATKVTPHGDGNERVLCNNGGRERRKRSIKGNHYLKT